MSAVTIFGGNETYYNSGMSTNVKIPVTDKKLAPAAPTPPAVPPKSPPALPTKPVSIKDDERSKINDISEAMRDEAQRRHDERDRQNAEAADKKSRADALKEEARRQAALDAERKATEKLNTKRESCMVKQKEFLAKYASLDAALEGKAFKRGLVDYGLAACAREKHIPTESAVCAAPGSHPDVVGKSPDAKLISWADVCSSNPLRGLKPVLDGKGRPDFRVGVYKQWGTFIAVMEMSKDGVFDDYLYLHHISDPDSRSPTLEGYAAIVKPEADGIACVAAAFPRAFKDLRVEAGLADGSQAAYDFSALHRALMAAPKPYTPGTLANVTNIEKKLSKRRRPLTQRAGYYLTKNVYAREAGGGVQFIAPAEKTVRTAAGMTLDDVRRYAHSAGVPFVELCTPELRAAGRPLSPYQAGLDAAIAALTAFTEGPERPEEAYVGRTSMKGMFNRLINVPF